MKAHLVLAVVLFSLFVIWDESLPTTSPKIEVTRQQSRQIAEEFLAQRGLSVANSRHSSAFDYSSRARVFFDRTLGQEALERLENKPLRLWWWENRWFKEGVVEEHWVDVSLNGRITYFWHKLPDSAAGGDLGRDRAFALAREFLTSQTLDLTTLELLDESSKTHPNRTDYRFSWSLKNFREANSHYKYDVRVQGDKVGYYEEYLQRPEAWKRSYSELRSRNGAASKVASTFGRLLDCLVILALVAHLVKGETTAKELNIPEAPWRDWFWSWKKSWALSIQAFRQSYLARCFYFSGLVVVLGEINELPIALHAHRNTNSYSQTVLNALISSAGECATWALWLTLLCWCCAVLSRQVFPSRIPYSRLFGWQALRTRGFSERVAVGLVLLGIHALFFRGFYWIAESLGAWSPVPVSYAGLLTGYLPWASALNVGFLAAVGEELVYRVFAISWLKRLGLPNWLAVTLPAALWGFQHCFYPQQPFFIRGLELTLLGIVYGVFFLRWGPIPGLVAHFSWNAYASSGVLIKSHDPYLILSGLACAGAMVWVLLISVYLRRRYGRLDYEIDDFGAAQPRELEITEVVEPRSQFNKVSLLVLAVLSILIAMGYHHQVPPVVSVRINAEQAEQSARRELAQRGIDVKEHRVALAFYEGLGTTGEYLWERGGLQLTRQIFPAVMSGALWQVRFFQESVLREYYVRVDAHSGKVIYYRASLSEDSSGANLEADQAEALARELVARRSGDEPAETVSSKATVRANRTDHEFSFVAEQSAELELGEARLLEAVDVLGETPQAYRRYLDINDDWRRSQKAGRWWKTLATVLIATVLGLMVSYGGYLGLKQIVGTDVLGSTLGRLLGVLLLFEILQLVNELPYEWSGYSTAQHPWSYWSASISGSVQLVIVLLVAVCLLWLAVAVLNPSWLRPTNEQKRVAIPLALVGVAIRLAVEVGRYLVSDTFHPNLGSDLPEVYRTLTTFPVLDSVAGSMTSSVVVSLAIGFCMAVLSRTRAWVAWISLLGLATGLVFESLERWADLGPTCLFYGLGFALAIGLWKSVLRRNPLAWFHFAFLYALTEKVLRTVGHPALAPHGWLIALFAAAWSLLFWYLPRRSEEK